MLRRVPAYQEIPAAEILFERVPACAGARLGAGTTMARAADRVGAAPHLSDVAKVPGWRGSFRRSSGHIDARRAVSVGSTGPARGRGDEKSGALVPSFSLLHRGISWRALVLRWAPESLLDLPCAQIGEHYGCYRLHQPEAERAMARSLDRYGQLSPVVVRSEERRVGKEWRWLGGGEHVKEKL